MSHPFHTFDWAGDERWLKYRASLTFPTDPPSEKLLRKFKVKFYKALIDASFDPAVLTANVATSSPAPEAKANRPRSVTPKVNRQPRSQPHVPCACSWRPPKHYGALMKAANIFDSHADAPVPQAVVEQRCDRPGKMICKACHLVKYCSRECQRRDWKYHKALCKSELLDVDDFDALAQAQAQIHPIGDQFAYGKDFHYSGNSPAYSMFPFEGIQLEKDMNFAYLASGDPRNLLMTLTNAPISMSNPAAPKSDGDDDTIRLNFFTNDLNFEQNVRTLALLTTLKLFGAEGAEAVIHMWYSVCLTPEHSRMLQQVTVYLLQDHLDHCGSQCLLRELFQLTERCLSADEVEEMKYPASIALPQLRFVLDHDAAVMTLTRLTQKVFQFSQDISAVGAQESWRNFMQFRHYVVFDKLGEHAEHARLSWLDFRRSGLLLPFGAYRANFTEPNPILLTRSQDGSIDVMIQDHSDPLRGWAMGDVISHYEHGNPLCRERTGGRFLFNDNYGALHSYVLLVLERACARLEAGPVTVSFMAKDACDAVAVLREGKSNVAKEWATKLFDVIDMSNSVDAGYGGLAPKINAISSPTPLLKPHHRQPDARVICYLMNWVWKHAHDQMPRLDIIKPAAARLPEIQATAPENSPLRTSAINNFFIMDLAPQFQRICRQELLPSAPAWQQVPLKRRWLPARNCIRRQDVSAADASMLPLGLEHHRTDCYIMTVLQGYWNTAFLELEIKEQRS